MQKNALPYGMPFSVYKATLYTAEPVLYYLSCTESQKPAYNKLLQDLRWIDIEWSIATVL